MPKLKKRKLVRKKKKLVRKTRTIKKKKRVPAPNQPKKTRGSRYA